MAATNTVRITEETRDTLRELAQQESSSMQDILAKAVEAYRRERILRLTNDAFAAMRADAETWAEEVAERSAWEATIADGLDRE